MIEMLKTREILKEHKKHYLCWGSCRTDRWLLSRNGEAGQGGRGEHHQHDGSRSHQPRILRPVRILQSCVCVCVCVVAQSCLTPCDPMDCNPLDFSVLVMFQARIPEWIAICYSRRSDPGIEPKFPASPALAGRFSTTEPLGKLL